jgi:glycosyltransferase involved in cell wall biosynthesis
MLSGRAVEDAQAAMAPMRPFFSVIVPTYNRAEQLAECLRALACLDYPRDRFEVIVVDDGSRRPLEPILAPWRDQLDLRLLTQANGGPALARNTGAARARGEFLAFTDDDCAPAPPWLGAMSDRFATTPTHAVGGRTVNALTANPYSRTSQAIMEVVYAHYNAGSPRFFATNNVAFPAAGFRVIGGFDASFRTAEDRDLCDRWLHHGFRMSYAPDAVVYHAHRLTLGGLLWQHFGYGRGAYRFHQARARRGSGRFRIELGFYGRLVGHPLTLPPDRGSLVLAGLLAVALAANTAGLFWELVTRPFDGRSRLGSGILGRSRQQEIRVETGPPEERRRE